MQDGPLTRTTQYGANEIYEGMDSTKAVLVIGNGRTGIEVVYRVGDEN
jgi:hypothetical protein